MSHKLTNAKSQYREMIIGYARNRFPVNVVTAMEAVTDTQYPDQTAYDKAFTALRTELGLRWYAGEDNIHFSGSTAQCEQGKLAQQIINALSLPPSYAPCRFLGETPEVLAVIERAKEAA